MASVSLITLTPFFHFSLLLWAFDVDFDETNGHSSCWSLLRFNRTFKVNKDKMNEFRKFDNEKNFSCLTHEPILYYIIQ